MLQVEIEITSKQKTVLPEDKTVSLEKQFLDYAYAKEGLRAGEKEWKESRAYMMPQVKALVGRYSKLDDEAFYRFYLPVDDALQQALKHSSTID